MSKKQDYNEAEWKAISAAPVAAGLLISLSDASGLVGLAKEAMAVGRAIAESASGDAPEVVKSLAESMKNAGGRPELPEIPTGDRAKAKEALIGVIRQAVSAVQLKSPAEVDSYKSWLTTVAARVASASKEGGLFGIGGTDVSEAEREGLRQLADALGTNARQPVNRS